MSIDYKITVMMPSDVDRVFSSDDEFREAIARRLTHSTVSDISCGNIIAEFESLSDAETAEVELTNLMEAYQSSYDLLVADIKKVFYNIVELTACHNVSRIKRVLSGIETSQAFVTFLIDQTVAYANEQAKANGEFDYNND
jgi:hypothetical protein